MILIWSFVSGHCALNIELSTQKSSTKDSQPIPKLQRDLTIDFVMKKLSEGFPSMSSDKRSFLQNNRKLVDKFDSSQFINEEMVKQSLTTCPVCPDSILVDWPFKAKHAYFLSLGRLKEISIPVKMCKTCRCAYYPQGHHISF